MANFEKYALEIAKNRIYNAVVLRLKGNAIMMILLALGYITSHMVRYLFFLERLFRVFCNRIDFFRYSFGYSLA